MGIYTCRGYIGMYRGDIFTGIMEKKLGSTGGYIGFSGPEVLLCESLEEPWTRPEVLLK